MLVSRWIFASHRSLMHVWLINWLHINWCLITDSCFRSVKLYALHNIKHVKIWHDFMDNVWYMYLALWYASSYVCVFCHPQSFFVFLNVLKTWLSSALVWAQALEEIIAQILCMLMKSEFFGHQGIYMSRISLSSMDRLLAWENQVLINHPHSKIEKQKSS